MSIALHLNRASYYLHDQLLCGLDECYFICFSGMMQTNAFSYVVDLIDKISLVDLIDKISLELKFTSNKISPLIIVCTV